MTGVSGLKGGLRVVHWPSNWGLTQPRAPSSAGAAAGAVRIAVRTLNLTLLHLTQSSFHCYMSVAAAQAHSVAGRPAAGAAQHSTRSSAAQRIAHSEAAPPTMPTRTVWSNAAATNTPACAVWGVGKCAGAWLMCSMA